MDWPGEKLVVRLWDTAEKGLAGLLRPWQIRRTERAQVDADRIRRLVEAKTHLEVEDILSRQKLLADDGQHLLDRSTPEEAAVMAAQRAVMSDELRSQRNVAKALLAAEAELRTDEQEPPEREVEDDWFFRWRKLTGGVSSEHLQVLWGRVLAGEVKSPGSFSLRTLDFLKNLSQEEARIIEKVAPFVLDSSFIVSDVSGELQTEGITVSLLLRLKDIGVVKNAEVQLQRTFESAVDDRFETALLAHDRAVVVRHEDRQKDVRLSGYSLTNVGSEVVRLGRFSSNESYVRRVARQVKRQQFRVWLCRFVWMTEDMIRYFDDVEL